MASFNFTIPNEINALLKGCADTERIAPLMLDEAAPIVVEKIKAKAPDKPHELKNAVKAKKAKQSKNGAYIAPIVFTGNKIKKSKSGKVTEVPNAILASVAEFGRSSGKHGSLPARPFIRPAIAECQDDVAKKMQEVFEREVEKK